LSFGSTSIIDTLVGSKAQTVKVSLSKSPWYGSGANLSKDKWKEIIRWLIQRKYLGQKSLPGKFSGTSLVCLQKGKDWLELVNKNYPNIILAKIIKEEHKLLFGGKNNLVEDEDEDEELQKILKEEFNYVVKKTESVDKSQSDSNNSYEMMYDSDDEECMGMSFG